MIERKNIDICRMCDEFRWTRTESHYPLYMCEMEKRLSGSRFGRTPDGFSIWHKLSTFLYPEPPQKCPYYVEHMVAVESGNMAGNLAECHRRLGYGTRQ